MVNCVWLGIPVLSLHHWHKIQPVPYLARLPRLRGIFMHFLQRFWKPDASNVSQTPREVFGNHGSLPWCESNAPWSKPSMQLPDWLHTCGEDIAWSTIWLARHLCQSSLSCLLSKLATADSQILFSGVCSQSHWQFCARWLILCWKVQCQTRQHHCHSGRLRGSGALRDQSHEKNEPCRDAMLGELLRS